ncbi:transglutaminase-like domain-containing protein [candidate division KSB1 bacterium]
MPDTTQLPFLLKLIDDDSPTVQDAIIRELDSYGPNLEKELMSLSYPPDDHQLSQIQDMVGDYRRCRLKESWQRWMSLKEDIYKLEEAFKLISKFFNGSSYPVKVDDLLDQLTFEFNALYDSKNVLDLAHFIFEDKQLKGADDDYYNYRNSDLVYVIQNKRGIPISLVCVYILVGQRLGLHIEGCNYPGHFLAKVYNDNEVFLVDCFHGGKIMTMEEFSDSYMTSSHSLNRMLNFPPTSSDIIRRVLLNLNRAYHEINNKKNSEFVLDLLQNMTGGDEDKGFS